MKVCVCLSLVMLSRVHVYMFAFVSPCVSMCAFVHDCLGMCTFVQVSTCVLLCMCLSAKRERERVCVSPPGRCLVFVFACSPVLAFFCVCVFLGESGLVEFSPSSGGADSLAVAEELSSGCV